MYERNSMLFECQIFSAKNEFFFTIVIQIAVFFLKEVYGIMFIGKQKKVAKVVCVKCRVIRSFILCVLMLLVLGFLLGDDAAYFRFLTPDIAAFIIIGGGTLLFIWKILEHYLFKRKL